MIFKIPRISKLLKKHFFSSTALLQYLSLRTKKIIYNSTCLPNHLMHLTIKKLLQQLFKCLTLLYNFSCLTFRTIFQFRFPLIIIISSKKASLSSLPFCTQMLKFYLLTRLLKILLSMLVYWRTTKKLHDVTVNVTYKTNTPKTY